MQSTTANFYSPTGQLLSKQANQNDPYYMVITSETLEFFSSKDDRSLGRSTLKREGSLLRLEAPLKSPTIAELTDHQLTLRYEKMSTYLSGDYVTGEDVYVR
ncbi:hypothetical protein [Hymenobacter chitinivorans]|uniref:Uncharacterized protein n=1 Tax=Hymenobacter chitinivorans DSM 11115 TaxID=1121954 RepID=A0A2M9BRP4_9BACT|nr:hypothetical protein [Hymenobacter chitinivorans]PJJ60601.1 hypothetical protein CLV45_2030 [Hymenobacter chitinivorans DSM 11115]